MPLPVFRITDVSASRRFGQQYVNGTWHIDLMRIDKKYAIYLIYT